MGCIPLVMFRSLNRFPLCFFRQKSQEVWIKGERNGKIACRQLFNLNIEFSIFNWIPMKTTDNMIFWMLSHIYKMEMNNIKSMMSNLILRMDSISSWFGSYFCHQLLVRSTLCFICDIFFAAILHSIAMILFPSRKRKAD